MSIIKKPLREDGFHNNRCATIEEGMIMKKLIICLMLAFFFFDGSLSDAVPLDMTSAGVEITGPNTLTLHNGLVGPNLYQAGFQWNPKTNGFRLVGPVSLEQPTFKASEYYPLAVGDTWTYQRSDGGTYTKTVTGTDKICGVTCMRVEDSDGAISWFVSDDTGVWLVQEQEATGAYTTFCPLRIANPCVYVGSFKLTPFGDAPYYAADGTQIGNKVGYYSDVTNTTETVSVPAGTFTDCPRGTVVNSWTETWGGNTEVTTEEMWFAEGIGPVKHIISTITTSSTGILLENSSEVRILQSATVGGVSYP